MRWLSLLTPSLDGASNMALDEALMLRAARTGEGVFRVYGWSAPTLSLGRNQRAVGCYDLAMAKALGVEFVRRPTGGRALLHDHEITYSATIPLADADAEGAHAAYAFINRVLLGALRHLGVAAAPASGTRAIRPGLRPCFDVPAEHEIAIGGRKLVGSAQWRHGGSLLQHGSILVRDDQPMISRLLKARPAVTPPAATLAESLGFEPSAEQVALSILESLEEESGRRVQAFEPDEGLEADARRLRETYHDESWTWRR
jgi:lipoyl(octanoyl) transferase